jgi:hypothetical protein
MSDTTDGYGAAEAAEVLSGIITRAEPALTEAELKRAELAEQRLHESLNQECTAEGCSNDWETAFDIGPAPVSFPVCESCAKEVGVDVE